MPPVLAGGSQVNVTLRLVKSDTKRFCGLEGGANVKIKKSIKFHLIKF